MENKWIFNNKRNQSDKYKLFCLPYAGAGATAYSSWQKLIGDEIDILAIQLPGRENRIGEPCVGDAKELAKMIFEGIKVELTGGFSIFGHSMGGILAYELTVLMEKELGIHPDFLFMSATTLTERDSNRYISDMSDEDLAQYLIKSGGTLIELINSEEFREAYFPIIRNDYGLVESYKSDHAMTSAKVRAFASYEDGEVSHVETENINVISQDFDISYLRGGHFYIQSATQELISKVKKEIIMNCFK